MLSFLALAIGLGLAVGGKLSELPLKRFQEAEARYQSQPENAEAAWQFGRACFDLAEFSTNSTERAALAERGIAACRQLVERDPKAVEGRYYLGMNMGQLARTKSLGALRLVKEMEREFKECDELQPGFDNGGPERNLGLLYRDAPVIGSIGSRAKAREWLSRAVSLAPEFPENRLALIEAYVKWRDPVSARKEIDALKLKLEAAHRKFSGSEWENSWTEWDRRLAELEKKLDEPLRLSSPK